MAKPDVVGDPFDEFAVDGRTLRFSEIRMATVGRIQQYLNRLPRPDRADRDLSGLPDRLAISAEVLATVPEAERAALVRSSFAEVTRLLERQVREARAEDGYWPPAVGSPEFAVLLATDADFQAEAFYHLLLQNQPEVPREESDRLFAELSMRQWGRVVQAAFQVDEEKPGPNPT